MNAQSHKPIRKASSDWQIIVPLWLLTFVPSVAGISRLQNLTSGAVNADNARFFAAPLPVVVHIVSVLFFCLLGAFQFASGFRRRYLALHKMMGRFLMVFGIASALSGLWMTVLYPLYPNLQGTLLYAVRLLVGSAMLFGLVQSWRAIMRRDVAGHQAWVLRAYALGQGAGTQVIIFLPWTLLLGQPDMLTRDILMSLAWLVNWVFAEWLIARQRGQLALP